MKKILGVILVSSLALGTSSCAGVFCAAFSGPLVGGTSLTARVWETESSGAVRIISTPFAFIAGTFLGWVPALYEGIRYDWENNPIRPHPPEDPKDLTTLENVWDPFSGGLWTNKVVDTTSGNGSR